MFKSGYKKGENHDINYENYEKSMTEMPVIVIDTASYHNVQISPLPITLTKKTYMIN